MQLCSKWVSAISGCLSLSLHGGVLVVDDCQIIEADMELMQTGIRQLGSLFGRRSRNLQLLNQVH